MKKKTKYKIGLLFLGGVLLSGCTQSFATVQDKANVLNQFDLAETKDGKTNFEAHVEKINATGDYYAPSEKFFTYIEEKVVEEVKNAYDSVDSYTLTVGNEKFSYKDLTVETLLQDGATRDAFVKTNEYALAKFAKTGSKSLEDLWSNYDKWTNEAINEENLTLEDVGSSYFFSSMKTAYNQYAGTVTAYITPVDGEFEGLKIEGKTWGEAFSYGLLEGLLVWPIAALLHVLTVSFNGIGAFGTILAIFIVTLIVRAVLLLCTFKSTKSQQKMTELQPKMAELQAKYPNAATNQYEKQALAQAQMKLYKDYNVNPFSMFITLIFQFPVFICVWGAMSGAAILRTGNLGGLQLSALTGQSIINWTGTPSVVALIIFIIMALTQLVSMLIPQFLQKRRQASLNQKAKAALAKQNSTMRIMNIFMIGMIIFMGFTLPVAMAIYWIISAIIMIGQTLVMDHITRKHLQKDNGYTKYKVKK